MSRFKEILNLCKKTGYLFGSKAEDISIGPVGALLSQNLKNEWLNSHVNNADMNIFLNTNDSLSDAFNYAKDLCNKQVPFGISHVCLVHPVYNAENLNEVSPYFNISRQIALKTHIFVPPSPSEQLFYHWQNQRRIWWRKFSATPSIYSLSEIKFSDQNDQNVEIVATYPWGSHPVEFISLSSNGFLNFTKEQLEVKDGKKEVRAHCITSTSYLFTMTLSVLCDAYEDETRLENVKRPHLRFHRMIAPYKISFSISSSSADSREELNDLALYLCKKIRKHKLPTLLLTNNEDSSLESQWCFYDQLGIPYTVFLTENTLKNGILFLRNRDTTLNEQVHIADLEEYVVQLYKNY